MKRNKDPEDRRGQTDYVGKNLPTSRNEMVQVRVLERDGEDKVVICEEE